MCWPGQSPVQRLSKTCAKPSIGCGARVKPRRRQTGGSTGGNVLPGRQKLAGLAARMGACMNYLAVVAPFSNPVSLLIVFGGAFAVTALRSTRADLAAAIAALRPLVRADPAADAAAARAAVGRIERVAEVRSVACVDRVRTAGRFLRLAAVHLAEAPNSRAFALWAEEEAEAMAARHARAAAVWQGIADAAPAMGMLGTIVGLSSMFATMDDGASIGPAMALAMLTTFYGVLLSSVIAGPIASRLERLSAEEAAWRNAACRRLIMLAAAELEAGPQRVRLRHAV
jgi:chemotaxis protein MotA